ncbi:hypothetical protein [Fulvivirga sedimenti]|nr:hypothetical protein [Fulvivirga sedimenti]
MKVRIALFLFVVFGLSACSQYTCPTYSKEDVKKEVSEEQHI